MQRNNIAEKVRTRSPLRHSLAENDIFHLGFAIPKI
jgi:hypothetical protein